MKTEKQIKQKIEQLKTDKQAVIVSKTPFDTQENNESDRRQIHFIDAKIELLEWVLSN